MDKTLKKELKEVEENQIIKLIEKLQSARVEAVRWIDEYSDIAEEKLVELSKTDYRAAEKMADIFLEKGDAASAYPYLKFALEYNSLFASEMLDMILDAKLVDVDRFTELNTRAVSEQCYDNKAGKILDKIENGKDEKDRQCLKEVDEYMLSQSVYLSLLKAYSAGKYGCLTFVLEHAGKKVQVRDYKRTYILTLRLSETINSPVTYEDYGLYAFYIRNNKESEASATLRILKTLEAIAEKAAENFQIGVAVNNIFGNCYTKNFVSIKDIPSKNAKEAFFSKAGNIKDEDVSLTVSTIEENVLEKNICAFCGHSILNGETKCSGCGNTFTEKKSETSKVDRKGNMSLNISETVEENPLTLLSCSQCGSPIYCEAEDGEAVLCKSCGASFVFNKKALGFVSAGLDRKRMEMEKPKNEEIPNVNFRVKSLYSGRLGVVMPDSFEEMKAEMKAIKYSRGTPPELVYTNPEGTINFCFSVLYGAKAMDKDIEKAGNDILKSFRQLMPSAEFGESGVVDNGGHKVSYFDCITAAEQDIYNYMMHFSLSGTLVRGSFNCLAKDRWFWGQIFKLATQSLRFS